MTLSSDDLGKLVAGQSITVTDANGVSGPAVVMKNDGGNLQIFVCFRHTDSGGDTVDTWEWFIAKDRNPADFGLKISPDPFRPAQREAQLEPDGGGEVERIVAPYLSAVNSAAPLLSLLYDANLLPEQIRTARDAVSMAAVCEAYRAGSASPTPEGQTEGALADTINELAGHHHAAKMLGHDSVPVTLEALGLILAALSTSKEPG